MNISRYANAPHNRYIKRSGAATAQNYVILEKGITAEISAQLLHAKYGIKDAIRILKEEYDGINPHAGYFTHFNLQYGGHLIGREYALPKILVQGYYKNDEDEFPPLLSFEGIYSGRCVRVKEHISYNELTEVDFEYSMNHIKNSDELKSAILRRYRVSLPILSEAEILRLGVSVTTLRLELPSLGFM